MTACNNTGANAPEQRLHACFLRGIQEGLNFNCALFREKRATASKMWFRGQDDLYGRPGQWCRSDRLALNILNKPGDFPRQSGRRSNDKDVRNDP